MPYYTVSHVSPLTMSQKNDLAAEITKLHSERFRAMRNFVNVRFDYTSPDSDIYIGGHRRPTNHINASVRSGPTRPKSLWDAHSADIHAAWHRVVVSNPAPRAKGAAEVDDSLHAIFYMEILGFWEAGFAGPEAGKEAEWLEGNWGEMVARAEKGEREWVENVEEARGRGMAPAWDGDGKTAVQRLEEELGWGDAA